MSDYFCYTAINTLLQIAALCVIDTPQKLYGKVLTSSKRERECCPRVRLITGCRCRLFRRIACVRVCVNVDFI